MDANPEVRHSPPEGVEVRPVPGFVGYYVGNDGSVWSTRGGGFRSMRKSASGPRWRKLKPHKNSNGYLVVSFRKLNASRTDYPESFYVAPLVLECFVGPRPEGMLACHINDVPDDNRLENLRWASPSANNRDAVRNGRVRVGRLSPNAKLSARDVEVAYYLLSRGVQRELVAAVFRVSLETLLRGAEEFESLTAAA